MEPIIIKSYKVTENGFTSILLRKENVFKLLRGNVFDCEPSYELDMVMEWLDDALIGEKYVSPSKNFSVELLKMT